MAASALGLSELASRYAAALFDLADEARQLDTVADDLRGLKSLLAESDDFRRLVSSPALSRDEQGRAVGAVLASVSAAELTNKFVGLLASKRRLFALSAMIDAFLAELAKRRGELIAQVTAARPLSEAQVDAVTDQIRRQVGAKVSVNVTIDPSLLGGLIVKVGSRMVDASLATKLNRLQFAMKGVS